MEDAAACAVDVVTEDCSALMTPRAVHLARRCFPAAAAALQAASAFVQQLSTVPRGPQLEKQKNLPSSNEKRTHN